MSDFENFKAFVALQPENQEINHSSYNTCAVGAWSRHIAHKDAGSLFYSIKGDIAKNISSEAAKEFYWVVGNGGVASTHFAAVDLSTYGRLSSYLSDFTSRHSV